MRLGLQPTVYCDVISGHFRHLNPAKITPGTKFHLYANFQDDRSTGLGANPGQTNKQTDRQTVAAYYRPIDASQEDAKVTKEGFEVRVSIFQ